MDYIIEIFKKSTTKRIILIIFISLILYLLRPMLNMFLLMFIFIFLTYHMQQFLTRKIKKVIRVNANVIAILLYVILLIVIGFSIYTYTPMVTKEILKIITYITDLYQSPQKSIINDYILMASQYIDVTVYLKSGANLLITAVSDIGRWSFNIFMALVLSIFFVLDIANIKRFMARIKESKLCFVYEDLRYIGTKFLNSFGNVMQAQVIIAFINSILSILILYFMGFPHILGFGAMIFFLGMIPVAGALISAIPLSVIAFNIGGASKVIYVLGMILLLHALESYVLNPKLMSKRTKLPVYFVFIILIISHYILGIWGLIVGIPIFVFLLNLLGIDETYKIS